MQYYPALNPLYYINSLIIRKSGEHNTIFGLQCPYISLNPSSCVRLYDIKIDTQWR